MQTGSASRNWNGITSSPDGSHLAAVTNGGDVYISSNYGVTWGGQAAAGTRNWSEVTLYLSNGYHIAAAAQNANIWTGASASNVNEFNTTTNSWQAVGSGTTPDNINALILDSASHLYSGSSGSSSGNDVNEYSNNVWSALSSTGAPTNVTAFAFGNQLQIVAP